MEPEELFLRWLATLEPDSVPVVMTFVLDLNLVCIPRLVQTTTRLKDDPEICPMLDRLKAPLNPPENRRF